MIQTTSPDAGGGREDKIYDGYSSSLGSAVGLQQSWDQEDKNADGKEMKTATQGKQEMWLRIR